MGVTARSGILKLETAVFRTDEAVVKAGNKRLTWGRTWASAGACSIGSRLDISQPHLSDMPVAGTASFCCSPSEQQQQEVAAMPQLDDKCAACRNGVTPSTRTAKSAAKSLKAGRWFLTVTFIRILMSFNVQQENMVPIDPGANRLL